MPRRADPLVEKMGLFFESEGFPRITGRIFGLLLLSATPLSLDALADRLRVSKASVSTDARLLERRGILERTSHPGDRRDYYKIAEQLPIHTMELRLERMRKFRALVAEARVTSPLREREVRERLEAIQAGYEHLLELIAGALNELREAGTRKA